MKRKKPISFFGLIQDILEIYLERTIDLIRLISLEKELAKKTALQVLILSFIFAVLFISTWLSLLTLFFLGLRALHINDLISALLIVVLNASLLAAIWFYIVKIKEDMFFPVTRKQLSASHRKSIQNRALYYETTQKKN